MTLLLALLLSCLLHVMGYGLICLVGFKGSRLLTHFLSFHLGLGICYLILMLVLFLGINSVPVVWLILLTVAGFLLKKRFKEAVSSLKFIWMPLAFTFCAYHLQASFLTGDSFMLVMSGDVFWNPNISYSKLEYLLNLWGILGVIAYSPGGLIGVELWHYFPALLTCYFLGAWVLFLHEWFREAGLSTGFSLTLGMVALGLFGTTYVAFFHANYVHLNLLSSSYLTLGLFLLWRALQKTESLADLMLACFFMVVFSLFRMEASLFVVTIVLSSLHLVREEFFVLARKYLTGVLFFLAAWNLFIASILQTNSHLAGPKQFLILSFVLVIVMLLLYKFSQCRRHYVWLIPIVGLVGHWFLVSFVSPWLLKSDSIVLGHFFKEPHWSWSWIWIVSMLIFGVFSRQFKSGLLLKWGLSVTFSFILLLLSLGAFRSSYRTGLGDSANRMILHIFPFALSLAMMVLVYFWVSARSKTHTNALP